MLKNNFIKIAIFTSISPLLSFTASSSGLPAPNAPMKVLNINGSCCFSAVFQAFEAMRLHNPSLINPLLIQGAQLQKQSILAAYVETLTKKPTNTVPLIQFLKHQRLSQAKGLEKWASLVPRLHAIPSHENGSTPSELIKPLTETLQTTYAQREQTENVPLSKIVPPLVNWQIYDRKLLPRIGDKTSILPTDSILNREPHYAFFILKEYPSREEASWQKEAPPLHLTNAGGTEYHLIAIIQAIRTTDEQNMPIDHAVAYVKRTTNWFRCSDTEIINLHHINEVVNDIKATNRLSREMEIDDNEGLDQHPPLKIYSSPAVLLYARATSSLPAQSHI